MKKKSFFLFLLLSSILFFSYIWSDESNFSEQLPSLKEELSVAKKLLSQQGGKNLKTEYQIIQLQNDILKIIERQENVRYQQISDDKKAKNSRSQFFKQSTTVYSSIKSDGLKLARNHPASPERALTHLILAINAMRFEENNVKFIDEEFSDAIKNAPPKDPSLKEAYTYSADFYYNRQEYSRAKKQFEKLISDEMNVDDKQKTKFLYTLSWCELKLKNYDVALNTMKRAYNFAKNREYDDFSDDILKNIPLFYLYSNQKREGITFLRAESKGNPTPLLNYGENLVGKGFEKDGVEALSIADDILSNKRPPLWSEEIHLLKIASDFKLKNLFLTKALPLGQKLIENSADQTYISDYNILVRNWISDLQKEYQKNSNSPLIKKDLSELKQLLQILLLTDKENQEHHLFSLGEIALFSKDYKKALDYYENALSVNAIQDKISESKKNDFKLKVLESRLAVLALAPEKTFPTQIYLDIYRDYIKSHPKSETTKALYPKLFNVYMVNGQLNEASTVIDQFHLNFPGELEKQQELLVRLLDAYIKKQEFANYSTLLKKLEGPEYHFTPEQLKKFNTWMGDYLFASTAVLVKNKDYNEAKKNYQQYYANSYFSPEIRQKSAYNLALLYLQLEDEEQSVKWSLLWLSMLPANERIKQTSILLQIGETLLSQQRLNAVATLYQKSVSQICEGAGAVDLGLYLETCYTLMALPQKKTLFTFLKTTSSCIPKAQYIKIVEDLSYSTLSIERAELFFDFYQNFAGREEFKDSFLLNLLELYIYALNEKQRGLISSVQNELQKTLKKGDTSPDTIKKVHSYFALEDLKTFQKELTLPALSFPEERFGAILKTRDQKLQNFSERIQKLMSSITDDANITVMSYGLLIESYNDFVSDLQQFKPPLEKKEEVESFKQAIAEITNPLKQKIGKWREESLRYLSVYEGPILNNENLKLYSRGDLLYPLFKYRPISAPLMIEHGGAPLK